MHKARSFIKNFWLFGRNCGTSDGRQRFLFYLWNWGMPLLMSLGTGLLSLLLAFGHYNFGVMWGYFEHPLIALLNLLPPLLLFLLLYCAIGRSWIAYLIESALVLDLSTASYFMLLFRDDPLMFADIANASTAMGVVDNYNLSMDSRLWFCVLCITAATVLLALFTRGKPGRGPLRLAVAAALLLLCVFPLRKLYTDSNVYNYKTQNYEHINRWSATQLFISKGYIYPFLHSVTEAFPTEPEDYDAESVQAMLASFTDTDIPDDKQVNVVVVMLEAFTDMSDWDIDGLSEDIYAPYHSLESESISGTLVTNIFAGGTTNTERGFLTGFLNQENFRSDVYSHVWYLLSQGFSTSGSHPCYDWFYNRLNINSYLGFQEYYFLENHYSELAGGEIAYDDIFFPELTRLLEEEFTENAPSFSFSITYQGHGPYDSDVLWWPACVEDEGYSEETWYIMNNYFGSVSNTIENITAMVDKLRQCEEPVVLLLFGDHKPWFGDSNSVYAELGINIDTSTEEGFYNYYSTSYLIWANDEAKEVLENDFVGDGPTISSNFLMNLLFEQCGWTGSAWMQYTDQLMDVLPVITSNGFYVTADGVLTTELTEENAQLLQDYKIVEYYMKKNYLY